MDSISVPFPKVAWSRNVLPSTSHDKDTIRFGLQVEIPLEEYRVDPLLKLGNYNHKLNVNVDVGFSDRMWT